MPNSQYTGVWVLGYILYSEQWTVTPKKCSTISLKHRRRRAYGLKQAAGKDEAACLPLLWHRITTLRAPAWWPAQRITCRDLHQNLEGPKGVWSQLHQAPPRPQNPQTAPDLRYSYRETLIQLHHSLSHQQFIKYACHPASREPCILPCFSPKRKRSAPPRATGWPPMPTGVSAKESTGSEKGIARRRIPRGLVNVASADLAHHNLLMRALT